MMMMMMAKRLRFNIIRRCCFDLFVAAKNQKMRGLHIFIRCVPHTERVCGVCRCPLVFLAVGMCFCCAYPIPPRAFEIGPRRHEKEMEFDSYIGIST